MPNPGVGLTRNSSGTTEGQVVAIAYDSLGRRLVQTREPYLLVVGNQAVTLPGESLRDTGHELFHLGTVGGIACASCHPEGHEDGHVWTFTGLGPRRTQSIGGGILGTEPFHWNGDMTDFGMLAHEVFGNRMSGPTLMPEHVQALANWIDKIPALKPEPVLDAAAVDRGRALFQDPTIGCATCHAGAKMTNNATVVVGTGAPFQVPSLLGVAWRAPYLHSGCAPTLEARFGDCGGGDLHGHTSELTASNRADLVRYLQSL
jgi:mono/diheme cytochrome c family protein